MSCLSLNTISHPCRPSASEFHVGSIPSRGYWARMLIRGPSSPQGFQAHGGPRFLPIKRRALAALKDPNSPQSLCFQDGDLIRLLDRRLCGEDLNCTEEAIRKLGVMSTEREDFKLSGPLHLINFVDWKNEDHRRSVAACLVQGVYVLERDRQENRQGPQALAPPWWEFFHFRIHTELVDDADRCIFGAIYEFTPPTNCNNFINEPPSYVIAFRGTLTQGDAVLRDLQFGLHVIKNGLRQTSRFEIAIQAVKDTVTAHGHSNIWVTGHSLGAAMAMLSGKTMAKQGVLLEAFLFNPPFFSAPLEAIKDVKVKQGLRIASSFLAAGLTVALRARNQNQQQQRNITENPFVALSEWTPSLFVHPRDHICSEYIGYFEHRKKMEEIGAGVVERLATQNSFGGIVMTAMGKAAEDPFHLLPSANLVVNTVATRELKQAHGIHQWWQTDISLQSTVHKYV